MAKKGFTPEQIINKLRETVMQPSLERALRYKENPGGIGYHQSPLGNQ